MKIRNIVMIFIGSLIGILTGYLRGFNSMSFWSLSDIADKFGFWIFTVSLIAYLSKNEKEAMLNSFNYMIFMCLFYYGYLYINSGILYISQFIIWGLLSVFVTLYSKLINKAKNNNLKTDYIINSIPIILLGIEFIDLLNFFILYNTNFIQLFIDFIGIFILIKLFTTNKPVNMLKKMILLSTISVFVVCLFFIILWSI